MLSLLFSNDRGDLPTGGLQPAAGVRCRGHRRAMAWLVALAALLAFRGPAYPDPASGQCVDYGNYLHWGSSVAVSEPLTGIAISDSCVFVTGVSEHLYAFDVTDSEHPRLVGSLAAPYWVTDIAASGDLACIADTYGGLLIVDISDPQTLVALGSVDTPGEAAGVAIARGAAFVADGRSGLQVVDLSNPGNPSIVGHAALPDSACAVALADSCAFIADNRSGLIVVDFRDLRSPQIIGALALPGAALDICVSGSHAYVVTQSHGLMVVDIGDPRAPRIVATATEARTAMAVCAADSRVLVMDPLLGVFLYEVDDPLAPRLIANSQTPGYPGNVAIGNNAIFVTSYWGGLHVLDTSVVQTVPVLGAMGDAHPAIGVAVAGGLACVACSQDGTSVVDISDPGNPRLLGRVATRAGAADVAIVGAFAFVADGTGLQVIDLSDPSLPVLIGAVVTPGYARRVAVGGSHAYIADVDSGLQVIDITDPRNPRIIGSLNTPGRAMGVAVDGDVVCIADYYDGLQVIDVSDPLAPRLVGGVDTPGIAHDVSIVGNYAYMADDFRGLQVIDISNPADPRLCGRAETLNYAESVDVAGTTAYVADGLAGLTVVDVTVPTSPRLVGSVAVPGGYGYGVATDGLHVCLAANNGAASILPCHCESGTPVLLTDFDLRPEIGAVTITWRISPGSEPAHYRVQGSTTSREWDVVGEVITDGWTRTVEDRSPLLSAGTFVTYRVSTSHDSRTWFPLGTATTSIPFGGLVTTIDSAYPNPLNPSVTIGFTCRRAGQVRLTIHDVAGRRVALLMDGRVDGGGHEAVWNGRDQSDRPVPSGQYVARLVSDDGESTRKLLLVR